MATDEEIQARHEFLEMAAFAMRHLVKQNVLEDAGILDVLRTPVAVWNNDTVVTALETLVSRQAVAWGLEYPAYTASAHGVADPITATLALLGLAASGDQPD